MTKKELRAAMKKRNLALTPQQRAAASERIFSRVEALPAFRAARCVACFCALGDEPESREALRRWSRERRVVLPRVEGDAMRFYEYDPEALASGAFGIEEPVRGEPCPPSEIDLVVVPGTAFARSGARMGRGRGFYDRYLAQPGFRAAKVGVCYAHQIVGALPAEPHDVPMDCVATDADAQLCGFIADYGEAFGPAAELPLVFRYTDFPLRPVDKVEGCLFKALAEARRGVPVSLNAGNIGCGGGRFYTGFAPMPEYVPRFVSLGERYKRTPGMVAAFVASLDVRPAPGAWLEFVRADMAGTFESAEGLLFFATPDMLAGLVAWASFDTEAADAVAVPFGSGCSTAVSQAVKENREGGQRCFLGLFDPSVRPWVGPDELGFVVPMSRLAGMCGSMRASCLFDAPAWSRVRERMNAEKTL